MKKRKKNRLYDIIGNTCIVCLPMVRAREFATRYDERSISNPTHKVIKIARVLIYVVIYLYDFSDCSVEYIKKNCLIWWYKLH